MSPFDVIQSIDLSNSSTWENKIFLTFDMDWASDEVLGYTLDIIERYDIPATWFVTHNTPLLKRLRDNPKFQLGIHPNFNPLLHPPENPTSVRDAPQILDQLMEWVPEATAVRSHSLTQSSRLLPEYLKRGIQYDCNPYLPLHSGMTIKPWLNWDKLIKVPIVWADDVYLIENNLHDVNTLISIPSIQVFDFHPIHIALNSHCIEHYEATRYVHYDWEQLIERQHSGFGIKTFLIELIESALESSKLSFSSGFSFSKGEAE